jgi:signal transduction histidine kinase
VSAPLQPGDTADGEKAGEVLRQAGAVVGRPVTLWEVTGPRQAVARASSAPHSLTSTAASELNATLRRWNVPIPVGSRWVASPVPASDSWLIAPVRFAPPAPPPDGRERRSRERLALELVGLAVGLMSRGGVGGGGTEAGLGAFKDLVSLPAMIANEANNPLAAARNGLQTAMEAIGRWVDLAADRRLTLLDDLGQVLEDIERATEFLRAVQERTRGALQRSERFDAVRVVRSCLTLERRLLRDRGIDLDFNTSLEVVYLKGDPNALFDLLVNLVRSAADATRGPAPVEVRLTQKGRDLEVTVRDQGVGGGERAGPSASLTKARSVAEGIFGGTVRMDAQPGKGTTVTIMLPVPPQREGLRS